MENSWVDWNIYNAIAPWEEKFKSRGLNIEMFSFILLHNIYIATNLFLHF